MHVANLLDFFFVLVTIFIISFIPGYLILRRWDLTEDERITASFGVSFIILYIFNFSLFQLNERSINPFYLVHASLILALIYIYTYRIKIVIRLKEFFSNLKLHKLKQLLQIEHMHLLILFLIIFIYTAFFESLIRSLFYFYTTGFIGNDWLGYYDESRFFSSKTTIEMSFMFYRTPLYYIVNGFNFRLFGDALWVYQAGNSILIAPFFLALYLLSKKLLSNESQSSKMGLVIILFSLLNPFFFINIIYPHSKIFAAYFILITIYFYLKLRGSSNKKIDYFLFGLFAGAGYMSHLLSLIYLAGMGIDYLILLIRRKINFSMMNAAIGLIPFIGLIAPWYIWAFGEYGIINVLSSNPPVWRTTLFFWIYSRAQDFFTSFIPVEFLYYSIYAPIAGIPGSFDKLFDSGMSFYYHTIPGAITISMTVFLIYRSISDYARIKVRMIDLFKNLKNHISTTSSCDGCMGILIIAGFTGGLLAVPAYFLAHHGLAMASFVPLVPLLLIYLTKYAYDSPPALRSLLFFGIITEFLVTIWAQLLITNFDLKSEPIPSEKTALLIPGLVSGNVFLGDYWIISLGAVVLTQLFFITNFYRLFVKKRTS